MSDVSEFITETTHKSSLPFYAIANLIYGGHHIDVTNALMHTGSISRQLGDMLRGMTDNQYSVGCHGDCRNMVQAIADVFEGERYGLGYDICEQIENLLNQGQAMVEKQLYQIAKQNLLNRVK